MNTPPPKMMSLKLKQIPPWALRRKRQMMTWLAITQRIVADPGLFSLNINIDNHPGPNYRIILDLVTIGKIPVVKLSGVTLNGQNWRMIENWRQSNHSPTNIHPLEPIEVTSESKIVLKLENPSMNQVELPQIFFMGNLDVRN